MVYVIYSPGADLITGTILKKLPDKAVHKIIEIFNTILYFQKIPKQFKEAVIILFHKKGKNATKTSSHFFNLIHW